MTIPTNMTMNNLINRLIDELSASHRVWPRFGRDGEVLAALRYARKFLRRRRPGMKKMIEEVMHASGRPMRAKEILEAMPDPPTTAVKPVEIVNKWLSTDPRFQRVVPGLYQLRTVEKQVTK